RRHAGADVRDVGELEQALDAAVLAERAVQHREDDVGAADRSRRRSVRQPARPARELDRVDVVAALPERVDDALGRGERGVVLAGTAALQDEHVRHGVVVVGAGGGAAVVVTGGGAAAVVVGAGAVVVGWAGVVVGVNAVVVGCWTRWPTVIVTDAPC